MNNIGTLQKIIEELNNNISSNQKFLSALILFVIINFIITAINIFFQFKLKNKEKSINRHNLIESKRIEAQENLYILLEKLTYYDGNEDSKVLFQTEISEINKFLTQKKIYIPKEIIKISQEFTDYNTSILCDYRKKSYEKEMAMLEQFNIQFNGNKS